MPLFAPMSLSRRKLLAALPFTLGLPSVSRAMPDARASLVELFTSQGCSSCPAADALIVRLADDPAFIPLTFPVEVWDYLGWKDTLAQPDFTRRQKAYAGALSGRKIYTPQAIVNGRASCVGSDFATISRLSSATRPRAIFEVNRSGEGWTYAVRLAGAETPAMLALIPIASRQTVAIGRGENSGRSITYANVAREIIALGMPGITTPLKGAVSMETLKARGADGFALIVQAGSLAAPGEGFGAALVTQGEIRL